MRQKYEYDYPETNQGQTIQGDENTDMTTMNQINNKESEIKSGTKKIQGDENINMTTMNQIGDKESRVTKRSI